MLCGIHVVHTYLNLFRGIPNKVSNVVYRIWYWYGIWKEWQGEGKNVKVDKEIARK